MVRLRVATVLSRGAENVAARGCSFLRKCRENPPWVRPAAAITSARLASAIPVRRMWSAAAATIASRVCAASLFDFLTSRPFWPDQNEGLDKLDDMQHLIRCHTASNCETARSQWDVR